MKSTPLFDKWRERLAKHLEADGAKTRAGESLAKHMGISAPAARVQIQRILAGTITPTAEPVLFLSAWMASKKGR